MRTLRNISVDRKKVNYWLWQRHLRYFGRYPMIALLGGVPTARRKSCL